MTTDIIVSGILVNLIWFMLTAIVIVTYKSDKSLMLKIPLWGRWLMGAVVFVPWVYTAAFFVCLAILLVWSIVDLATTFFELGG